MEMINENLKEQVLTVSELTDIIKELLEGSFQSISLEGEISNYRPSSTGHLYFTLKDSSASIQAVMFKSRFSRLSFTPKDGMVVKVKGSVSVYAQRGSYQIIVNSMEEKNSEGDILLLLEKRKREFMEKGYFEQSAKKPLPRYPSRIGVVTSPTGAALQDILQITKRRNDAMSVVILPCAVQGEKASEEIAKMIKTANTYGMADVLIVGRGGGSLEDLLPFSEECVVKAIFESEIPVISAVGHEIDWALSDFAADVRAPTPSAAAELSVFKKQDVLDSIENIERMMHETLTSRIEKCRFMLGNFSVESMELRFRAVEGPFIQRLEDARKALYDGMTNIISRKRHSLEMLEQKMNESNPKAILERGFSVVRNKETKKIITCGSDVSPCDEIEIIPGKGMIVAKVLEADECRE